MFKKLIAATGLMVIYSLNVSAQEQPQVLVSVAGAPITDTQLEQAIASMPGGDQFLSMAPEEQARVRGELLKRIIASELFHQEALRLELDKSPQFEQELNVFRTGLLYQRYIEKIRGEVPIPAAVEARIREEFRGDGDAIAAALSAYIGNRYPQFKNKRLFDLSNTYDLKVYEGDLGSELVAPDTVLATGDGFSIRRADLVGADQEYDVAQLTLRLDEAVEVAVFARAAIQAGIDIENDLEVFRRDLLAKMLLAEKQREWIPSEEARKAYYESHEKLGYIPAVWHIGQIVLKTRDEAEALRQRILGGESLFLLAEQFSIDPFGREQRGDMGWVHEGRGMPQLDAVAGSLEPGEISDIIESPMGFHIITVLDRRVARRRYYDSIPDQVTRAMINEKMPTYLSELQNRYKLQWQMPDHHLE